MTNGQKIRIDHLNMSVKNMNESVAWYKLVFGFEVVEQGMSEGEPWAIIRKDETMLCLYQRPSGLAPVDNMPHLHVSHFGLNIESRELWEDTVKQHKITVMYGGAIRYPHSLSWYVADPSGHEIEVTHWTQNNQILF